MSGSKTNLVLAGMLAGVVLGALLGYLLPEFMLATSVVGTLFLNALKVIIIPLIITSMVVGISSLGDIRRLGRTGGYTLVYFIATTAVAVVIGSIIALVIGPGAGIDTSTATLPAGMAAPSASTVADFFMALIPDNLFAAMARGQYLGIIVLALVFGGILTTLGHRNRQLVYLFRDLYDIVVKAVFLVMYTAPIGLLSVVGAIVAANRDSIGQLAQGLGWYALTLVIGLLIHGGLVLPTILRWLGKRKANEYVANMAPAFVTAFGTSSSSATLPVNYECVVERNKVDTRAASFVLPLGATINMDGTAMYIAVATIFTAQAFGVPLSIAQVAMVGLTAILISIGAPGLPSSAFFMLPIAFGVADFPPAAYAGLGLILAVDWILDRCRTVVNIWGDAVGAAVVDRQVFQRPDHRPVAHGQREQRDRFDRGRGRFDRGDRQERGERPDRERFEKRGSDSGGGREGRDRDRGGRFGDRHGRRDGRPGGRPDDRERRPDRPQAPSPFSLAAEPEPFRDDVPESQPGSKASEPTELPERGDQASSERPGRFPRGDRPERGDRHDRGPRRDRERGEREGRDRFERRDRSGDGRGRFQRDRRGRQRGPRPYDAEQPQPTVTPLPDDNLDLSSERTPVRERMDDSVPSDTRGSVMPDLDEVFGDDRLTQPVDRATSENLDINLAEEPDTDDSAHAHGVTPEPVQWGRARHRRGEHHEDTGDHEEVAPPAERAEEKADSDSPILQIGEPTEFGRRPRRRTR